jgi:hypothetical protein
VAKELTRDQQRLQDELRSAIREALSTDELLAESLTRATRSYEAVAEILVELRHQFAGPNGEQYDLRGRSASYRRVVRSAYIGVGEGASGELPKRLTSGVAYWVRRILIARYGEEELCRLGVIRPGYATLTHAFGRGVASNRDDPAADLVAVVASLNALAADPKVKPSEEVVRAALRAVSLLQVKLRQQIATVA